MQGIGSPVNLTHQPVMLPEVMEFLAPQPGGIYADCTLGAGGHAEKILLLSSPDGRLLGFDWDRQVLAMAEERLGPFAGRVKFFQSDFRRLPEFLAHEKISHLSGVLFDLGTSSLQLDDPQRGFSFQQEGPLDMRMNKENATTAARLIAHLREEELADLFHHYGQERFARRLAREIVKTRRREPITTTTALAQLVKRTVPYNPHYRIHPATRVFQALRIAVNRELEGLGEALAAAAYALGSGGRLVVISFHSLEDRIVKETLKKLARPFAEAPAPLRILTPKPLVPSLEEIRTNPRSRSAKLRAAERI